MISNFDAAILGTGTMGSAAAYFLAQSGLKVIAFERFRIAHEMGSHSGATRVIRHAYHESPDYVPLVLRSDQLWQELEGMTGRKLLVRTGGLDLGPAEGTVVNNALLACSTHGLPHEHINAAQVEQRWPQFRIPGDWHACFDPNMGFLIVDDCIRSYAEVARKFGVTINEEEEALDYSFNQKIVIRTSRNQYETSKMIVCAGAWNPKLLGALHLPFTVKRKTLVWLRVENPEPYQIGKFPIFLAETGAGLLYGFPIYGHPGLKVANHHSAGPATDPDSVNRNFEPEDAKDSQEFAAEYLNGVSREVLQGKICLYTMTPDEHFVIDLHPQNENIAIAAGFSGHGFKFAPVVGEILADLITKGSTTHPIEKFRVSRFNPS